MGKGEKKKVEAPQKERELENMDGGGV